MRVHGRFARLAGAVRHGEGAHAGARVGGVRVCVAPPVLRAGAPGSVVVVPPRAALRWRVTDDAIVRRWGVATGVR